MPAIPWEHPTAVAVIVLASCMCIGSLVQWLFLLLLRRRYPQQWIHAGKPTLWTDQSLISAWPTIRYLQRGTFRVSGDRAGIAFCQRGKWPMIGFYWMTVICFLAVGVSIFVAGWPAQWR